MKKQLVKFRSHNTPDHPGEDVEKGNNVYRIVAFEHDKGVALILEQFTDKKGWVTMDRDELDEVPWDPNDPEKRTDKGNELVIEKKKIPKQRSQRRS